MTRTELRRKIIGISGWVLVVFSALNMIWSFRLHPSASDLILYISYGAIAFTGLLATLVAESLSMIEQRLNQIESNLAPGGRNDIRS